MDGEWGDAGDGEWGGHCAGQGHSHCLSRELPGIKEGGGGITDETDTSLKNKE